jgi:uncharacterized membrane protein
MSHKPIEMTKGRLEAFSDGVIAVIITIMVLELKVPHGTSLIDLQPMIPIFLSYILSFIFVGIYWNNHHHMLQAAEYVHGGILWANLHFLFWLSLIPFATAWLGENHLSAYPVMAYGMLLAMLGISYAILSKALIANHRPDSLVATAIGSSVKGRISIGAYLLAVAVAFYQPWISCLIYVGVAAMWIVPERRVEKAMVHS